MRSTAATASPLSAGGTERAGERLGDAPSGVDRRIGRSRVLTGACVLAMVVVAIVAPWSGRHFHDIGPAAYFWQLQDVTFVPLVLLALLARPTPATGPLALPNMLRGPAVPMVVAASLVLICWIGHGLVFDRYDLSRDEQMATFDATIFAHGHVLWPIPATWRPFAPALNLLFMLPIGANEAWVSAYLPVNAAFRAAIGHFADAALTAPLFVGIGALALWRIALRLWPESPSSGLVALVLYAGSAQIVVTGMTAYAMSAHLALDLLWLALFLRGGRAAIAGTVAIGFLATGLHQPLFHPLFVLPFLDLLRRQGRWRLLAVYVVAYAAIGAFWVAWPVWIGAHGVTPAPHSVDYLDRLVHTVHAPDMRALWLMALNLLRFATWQHVMLLPLLALGLFVGRDDPLARALAIGLALPVVVMAIILPLQGHGYGYRYLHGVLGNACLLGGFGWRWLETRGLTLRRPFVWASLVSVAIVIPAHAFSAHLWVDAYARVGRAMAASTADIVVVEDRAVPWGQDIVVNRPDLTNRPILLLAGALRPQDMPALCQKGSIAFFDRSRLRPVEDFFGTAGVPVTTNEAGLEAAARAAHCTVVTP